MKKIVLITLLATCFILNGTARTYNVSESESTEITKSVHVPAPGGTLSSTLSIAEQRNIKELTITGTLNEEDWVFLKNLGSIRYLDISELTNKSLGSTAVGNGFFMDNKIIEEVKLPKGLTLINLDLFRNSSIKTCDIPSTVRIMGDNAFRNSQLTGKVVIPSGIKTIYTCFTNTDITEVVFNEGLEAIKNSAFMGCKGLTTIKFPSTLIELLAQAFVGTSIAGTLVLPESLQKIGYRAFQTNLLETVYSKSPTPPDAGSESQIGLYKVKYLGVPIGSKEAYEAASGWKQVLRSGIIEEVDFQAMGL